MTEFVDLIFPWAAGCVLGAVFFGGLWWTVTRGLPSKTPWVWFLAGLAPRLAIVLVGFYFVGRFSWERLAVCLVGFVMARVMMVWYARKTMPKPAIALPEKSHTP